MVMMALPAKSVCRFNTVPIKIWAGFVFIKWQVGPKIHKEMQGTLSSQKYFEKEE